MAKTWYAKVVKRKKYLDWQNVGSMWNLKTIDYRVVNEKAKIVVVMLNRKLIVPYIGSWKLDEKIVWIYKLVKSREKIDTKF